MGSRGAAPAGEDALQHHEHGQVDEDQEDGHVQHVSDIGARSARLHSGEKQQWKAQEVDAPPRSAGKSCTNRRPRRDLDGDQQVQPNDAPGNSRGPPLRSKWDKDAGQIESDVRVCDQANEVYRYESDGEAAEPPMKIERPRGRALSASPVGSRARFPTRRTSPVGPPPPVPKSVRRTTKR